MPMDIDLRPSAEKFRDQMRQWLEANRPDDLDPEAGERGVDPGAGWALLRSWTKTLHEAGYLCVSWPKEYGGRGLTGIEVAVMNEPGRPSRRWPTCRCTWRQATPWPSRAPPAPGSRRWSSWRSASTTPPGAGCWSTGCRSSRSTSRASAAGSATCPRSRSCSRAPCATTSPTPGPTPPTPRSRPPPGRWGPTTSSPGCPPPTCSRWSSSGAGRCRADRVVVLDGGRVVETGPHDALLAAGGAYASLWGAPAAAGG